MECAASTLGRLRHLWGWQAYGKTLTLFFRAILHPCLGRRAHPASKRFSRSCSGSSDSAPIRCLGLCSFGGVAWQCANTRSPTRAWLPSASDGSRRGASSLPCERRTGEIPPGSSGGPHPSWGGDSYCNSSGAQTPSVSTAFRSFSTSSSSCQSNLARFSSYCLPAMTINSQRAFGKPRYSSMVRI